jgi:mono/diheme cytochrome c family protein
VKGKNRDMRAHLPSLTFSLLVLAATTIMFPRLAAAETAAISPAATKEAGEIFTARCALCHGASGKGDGAAAAGLNPKPRDYSDPTWQASVTDGEIEKIIVGGGTGVGKSAMMPANPDLASKPDVVKALRASIRRFGSKKSAPTQ